jgi:hypothetical protein
MRAAIISVMSVGLVMAGAFVPTTASAEPMPTGAAASSCKQLRADYSAGIAKNAKSARKVVKKGYRRPLVCPRVYKQIKGSLDPNRNGVACEVR